MCVGTINKRANQRLILYGGDTIKQCRSKDKYEYQIASPDTARNILNEIGFGEDKCKETYEKDHRYGFTGDDGIQYGFENSMKGNIPYGYYVLFDYYEYDCCGYEVLSPDEFNKYYETI